MVFKICKWIYALSVCCQPLVPRWDRLVVACTYLEIGLPIQQLGLNAYLKRKKNASTTHLNQMVFI